jgi:hypothetical protein
MNVLLRLSAFILLCIGVQIIWMVPANGCEPCPDEESRRSRLGQEPNAAILERRCQRDCYQSAGCGSRFDDMPDPRHRSQRAVTE